MGFDASSDQEYGPTELDKMIEDEFFDSSGSDEEVDMIMLMSMQVEMDRQVEHILNLKGSIKGRRVINQDRVSAAKLLHRITQAYFPGWSIVSSLFSHAETIWKDRYSWLEGGWIGN